MASIKVIRANLSIENNECPCDKSHCIKQWKEFYDPYDVNLIFAHCDTINCHTMFYLHNNGYRCVICDEIVCNYCAEEGYFNDNDKFICNECK